VLQHFRSRLRHAWLMHGYLIATLALLPSGRFKLHADEPEPETWAFDRSESSLQAYLEAPDGTTDINSGSSRSVKVTVEYTTWDVLTSNYGNTSIVNQETAQQSGANVTFSIANVDGAVSTMPGTTTDGILWTTLQMGMQSTRLQADCSHNGVSASATLDFSIYVPAPEPEVWNYTRTEGVLSASLSAGSSTDVPAGLTQTVTVHAQYDTWEIWTSNYGNVETRSPTSLPASEAAISWSLTGDGGLDHTTIQADSNGNATADFTMGQGISEISAGVNYASSASSVMATLSFAPPIQVSWVYDHSEGYVSTTLTTDGSTTDVTGGSQRLVTAAVTYASWDVYRRISPVSGEYEYDMQNRASGPAINANVSFSVSGTGSLADSGGYTDENGKRTVSFTMGSGEPAAGGAEVRADVSFLAASGYGTITFSQPPPPPPTEPPTTPPPPPEETWSKESDGGVVNVSASSSGASVSYETWEVWVSNLGNHETRTSSGTAINAPITCSVTAGDAVVSSCDSSTNSSGIAAYSVEGGSVESTVTVSASFAGMSGSATFTVAASDLDDDGCSDAAEHTAGTNPNDSSIYPGSTILGPLSSIIVERVQTSSGIYEEEFDLFGVGAIREISGHAPGPPDEPAPAGYHWSDLMWTCVNYEQIRDYSEVYTWLPLRYWWHYTYHFTYQRLAVRDTPPP
jgi:hypothetical protein